MLRQTRSHRAGALRADGSRSHSLCKRRAVSARRVMLSKFFGGHGSAVSRIAKKGLGRKGKMIEVVSNHYLGPKKSIAVVRVAGRVLVLGVSNESINLITQLSGDDSFDTAALAAAFGRNRHDDPAAPIASKLRPAVPRQAGPSPPIARRRPPAGAFKGRLPAKPAFGPLRPSLSAGDRRQQASSSAPVSQTCVSADPQPPRGHEAAMKRTRSLLLLARFASARRRRCALATLARAHADGTTAGLRAWHLGPHAAVAEPVVRQSARSLPTSSPSFAS